MKRLLVAVALCSSASLAMPYIVPPGAHGSVRFVVEGPIDDVPGETRDITGRVELDPEKWTQASGVVAVNLTGIRTGIAQRDEDMREEFLETARFPTATLQLERIERPSPGQLGPGQTVEGEGAGTFEVHGVRRRLRWPLSLRMESDGKVWVKGRFEVAFADYSISRPQRLFLKLGDVAQVTFEVLFMPRPSEAALATLPAVSEPLPSSNTTVLPEAPKAKPRPPRRPKPQLTFTTLFSGDDARAKGERLFHSTDTGGAGNKLTCFHCHAKADERSGLKQADGFVRAGSTMWNAGQRGSYWHGFASSAGQAGNICQKMFMKGSGLSKQQQDELTAFVAALSPDSAVPLDSQVLFRTYDASLRDPLAGDANRGKKLADTFCMTCHLDGRVGPVWQPGLYEPDWIVARVRHLEKHSAKLMPPFSIQRLTDSELRDIVTYLAGPKAGGPVFDRKKRQR